MVGRRTAVPVARLTLINPTDRRIEILALRRQNTDVLTPIRAQLLETGKLEDAEDALTVLPGESLTVDADTLEWMEWPN